MARLQKLLILVVIIFSIWGIGYYIRAAERTMISETRLINTRGWLAGGGPQKRGFTVAEHRFHSASELRFYSASNFHKVTAEYHLTTSTFEKLQARWLNKDSAIYLHGERTFQGGSYSMATGQFEILYDYEHNHLWTTLPDFYGQISKQEFDEILNRLEHHKTSP